MIINYTFGKLNILEEDSFLNLRFALEFEITKIIDSNQKFLAITDNSNI